MVEGEITMNLDVNGDQIVLDTLYQGCVIHSYSCLKHKDKCRLKAIATKRCLLYTLDRDVLFSKRLEFGEINDALDEVEDYIE